MTRNTKWIYSGKSTQKDYESILVESRTGIEITQDEVERIDNIITPLIDNGHSIHHIHSNNKDSFMVC
ncbi:MAG: hypothetical protein PHR70_09915 [Tissierellia bacterium]|nr:hypothetical protein [Tissierellia bacterium]